MPDSEIRTPVLFSCKNSVLLGYLKNSFLYVVLCHKGRLHSEKAKKNFDISLICTTFAPSLQSVGQGVLRLSRLR